MGIPVSLNPVIKDCFYYNIMVAKNYAVLPHLLAIIRKDNPFVLRIAIFTPTKHNHSPAGNRLPAFNSLLWHH
jgi:hypothetical protein